MKVLLAEDEVMLSDALVQLLAASGYEADAAYDGEEALRLAQSRRYDFLILDIMMPKRDGLSVLDEVRRSGDATPVLMLTAKAEVEDRVAGLDRGANDYLSKPFSFGELTARLRALARTREALAPQSISGADWTAKRESGLLSGPAGSMELCGREYRLLELLSRHPGQPLEADLLKEKVFADAGEEGTAELYVDYLCHKLFAVGSRARIRPAPAGGWVYTA